MSLSEKISNGYRFGFLVVFIFMKNLFIVLEITLSFIIIASFATSVTLLELDPLLMK